MAFYQITEKGSEKWEDFWSSLRTQRTWYYTNEDQIESNTLEQLWTSDHPIWIRPSGAVAEALKRMEKQGLIRRAERGS